MRSFVQDYVFTHVLTVIIDYAFICLIIAWKAQYNTRRKSEGIKDEVMLFGWDKQVYWVHFGTAFIFIGVSVALFGADFGWLLDIFCWIGFLIGLLMFFSFFFIDKTYFLKSEFIIVPAYGKRTDHYYASLRGVRIIKKPSTDENNPQVSYKVKLVIDDETEHEISDDPAKTQSLVEFLREKVDHEKFEVVVESVETEDETTEDNQAVQ